MSTVTAPRAAAKSSRSRPFSCRFASALIEINGTLYQLTKNEEVTDPFITLAWRLEKMGDPEAVYDICGMPLGLGCSCPDWQCRHDDYNTSGCKHIMALCALGFIDRLALGLKPDPVQAPAPALLNGNNRNHGSTPAPAIAAEPVSTTVDIAPAPTTFALPSPPTGHDRIALAQAASFGIRLPEVPVARDPGNAPAPACCPADEPQPCGACIVPADVAIVPEIAPLDEADEDPADEGDDWDLDDRIGLVPDPDVRLTMLGWIEHQVTHFQLMDSDLGDLVATHLGLLINEIKITGARTPAEALDRLVSIEQDQRDQGYDLAYAQERLAEAEAVIDGRF